MIASVGDFPGAALDEVLASQVAGLRAAIKGELTTTKASLNVDDKSWPGLRLELRRPGETKVVMAGHMLAFTTAAKAPRLVLCMSQAARPELGERCNAILARLADEGPQAIKLAPQTPLFLGKPVAVPAGCKVLEASETGFRIDCGEAAHVMLVRAASTADLSKLAQMLSDQLLNAIPGLVKKDPRSCRVGGVESRCAVYAAKDGSATFYIGTATVDGAPTLVECGQGAASKGLHPVCAPLLAL